ncbi:MAG: probable membrane protein STY4873 [uncultured Sphingomonadaceae bacterium]|uniref:Probable membrane protein STY4873 n=1 Tax=uncultured Sphingomonadaceae bacterium TaxID=169976 RepID=A0A6J4S538_9SPHN|nr:MAG: probable membrane protein STY4873 [uncultured Sphingomonadaceae bacterium]
MRLAPFAGEGALAQGGARTMRRIATGSLVAMAVVFLVATAFLDAHPAVGFVRAFAEAAMVGGLADWFAVTALFRHPLGLPIPHTAIIPKNKDRIGDTLALFLKENFLTPRVVARRMAEFDVAAAVGRFLERPPGQGRLREGASRLAGDVLESLADERLGGMVKGAVASRLRSLEIAPIAGQALHAAIGKDRHVELFDGMIRWAGKALDANEDVVRAVVYQRAGWVVRLAGLDERLADAILNGLRKLVVDIEADRLHPIRLKAEEGFAELAHRLQHDAELRAKVEGIKEEVIANQAVAAWIDRLWEGARTGLLNATRDPERVLAGRFGEALRALGGTLRADAGLRETINKFARRAVVGAVDAYGDALVGLVSSTVRGWNAGTITDRLEGAVGRDLQYIRINGTVVGGTVGLLIHAVEVAL